MRALKFQSRLFLVVALLITLLFIAAGTTFDYLNRRFTRQVWESAGQQTLRSITAETDRLLTEMDTASKDILASSAVLRIMRNLDGSGTGNYFDTHPREADQIASAIYSAAGSAPLTGQTTVVSRYGDYVYLDNRTGDYTPSRSAALALPEVRWGLFTDDYRRYFEPRPDDWHVGGESVLTLTRPLRDSYGTYGVILCTKPVSMLADIGRSYLAGNGAYLVLLDARGEPLFEFSPQGKAPSQQDWYDATRLTATAPSQYYHNRSHVSFMPLETTGWRLVLVRDGAGLRAQITQFRITLGVICAVALLGMLLFADFLTRRLTVPLCRLRGRLDDLSLQGALSLPPPTENDEINALSDTISTMVQRFRVQNDHLLAARERELQSHLNAMEAQLDSHFLYNTLAVIGAIGQMEGSTSTPRLCAKLASLLRYSVDYHNRCVTLGDEIGNVRDYLTIMEMRYAGQTDFRWSVDAGAADIVIPKLILQPIVENCFKHGFADAEGMRRISITVQQDGTRWCVAVSNNGNPPTQTDIEGIYARFAQYQAEFGNGRLDARAQDSGFGLGNTVMRLHLFYKGEECFHMEVRNGETVVEIGGPIHAQ